MKNREIAIITLTTFASAFAGCNRDETAEVEVIENATVDEAMLTATAKTKRPTPVPPSFDPIEVSPSEPAPTKSEPEPIGDIFEPKLSSIDGLSVVRLVTSPQVENREPQLAASSFAPDEERVYAFVEAKNESAVPKKLRVHFIGPEEKVSGGIELDIPASSPRWRTWAYTRHAKTPGLWRVEVRDEGGALIGALPFEIEAP